MNYGEATELDIGLSKLLKMTDGSTFLFLAAWFIGTTFEILVTDLEVVKYIAFFVYLS